MCTQRLFVLTSLVSLAVCSVGQGEDYPLETFDYPAEQPLNETKAAQGWASGWMADAELKQELPLGYLVTADSLTSAAFEQHGLQPSGGKFAAPLEKKSVTVLMYREMEQTIDWSAEGDDLYFSALVRWDGNHTSKSSRMQIGFGESEASFNLVYVALAGTGEANEMNLVVRNNGATEFGEKALPAGETYFLVAKITTRSGADPDRISASIFGPNDNVPGESPADWDVEVERPANGQATSLRFISNLYLNGRKAYLDELRFGPSWESVTSSK